jgi:glycosyltransferase involved in cell wall biosynthesis
MKLGVVSPFMPHEVADLLDQASREKLACIRGVPAPSTTALVRGWHQRGHAISIFCLDPSVTNEQVLQGERLTVRVLPKRRSRHCLRDFYHAECRLVQAAVQRETPDVLSAQWTYDHAWAALQCGLPTMVTCHDTPWRYAWIAKNWFTTYQLLVAWRVIRKADRLVAVSPYTAQHIESYFRPRAPVTVVPNGVQPEIFQRGERRLKSARHQERPFTVCSVGGWGGIKNIATLLNAFAQVRAQQPDVRLVLFGRELGRGQAAEHWARHRNLHPGVVFQGGTPHDQVLDFLETEADLMVHPSLIETHGLAIVEAMACGVPVIAGGQSGAVAWTLNEGRDGYLCDIRDAQALAKKINEARRQPDGNRALVERAWASAKQRFNLDQAVIANEAILQQLVEERRQAA